jgi:uncharacterized membrane protein
LEKPELNALFVLFLFLHVLSAIIAFGPTFAFPLIAAAGQRNPQHAAFAAEISLLLEDKLVIPFVISMAVTGVLMIIVGPVDLFQPWLLIGIVVYLVAVAYSVMIQTPASRQMAQLLAAVPAHSPGPGAVVADAAGGPPPGLAELGKKLQRGGIILTVLLLAIIALMVIGGETTFLH